MGPGDLRLEFGPRSRSGPAWGGLPPPPVLTGPPDFVLILVAGIAACSLARSLGKARAGFRQLGIQGRPQGRGKEHQGRGEGHSLGLGRSSDALHWVTC